MILGVPVLNRPDLLQRMLLSIDVEAKVVVIDNGGVTDDLSTAETRRNSLSVIHPPSNLGVAASWNLIIRAFPAEPWWCLVNADVEFAPGDLARLCEVMADPFPKVAMLVEFGAFGINAAAVDAVGFIDENFHPIYAEDSDYRYRCRLAGVPLINLPSGATHVSSATYRSDPALAAANARTYPQNVAYYRAKWGGWLGEERFTTPFDMGGHVGDWRLQRQRLAAQAWP